MDNCIPSEQYANSYRVGDLVQSTVKGLVDFEYNSYGKIGILLELIASKGAAKVWWIGESGSKTVLCHTFKLLSRTNSVKS